MISFDKTPLEHLDLSRRAMNVLKRMNVSHLGEQYKLAKLGLSLQNPRVSRRFAESMRIMEEIKRLKQTIAVR